MSTLMVSFLLVLFQFLIFSVQAQSGEWETQPPTEFIFKGFRENNNSEIQTEGAAAIKPDGNLSVTGTAFYRKPSLPALATEVVSASPSHRKPSRRRLWPILWTSQRDQRRESNEPRFRSRVRYYTRV
ncbi:unnamed protein product [Brassica oleracea]